MQDGSEVSHSTGSTILNGPANGDQPPRRRKSVRMSLPPTFSATPPAIEDTDEDDEDAMDVDKREGDADADAESDEEEILDWCAYVNTFDVCITTYNTLQHDLGVARPPPTRPRRNFVQYSTANRPRSPLVMCEWYRVIMDEVQMVGGGKAE